MTREEFFSNAEDAARAIYNFIVKCIEAGGEPRSIDTYEKGNYIGRTWYCYGAADQVHAVRIFAPKTDVRWREFIERCEKEYGDYRIFFEMFPEVLPANVRVIFE